MHHMPNDLERGERYHTTTLREGTLLVCIGAAEKNKSSKTSFRETFPQWYTPHLAFLEFGDAFPTIFLKHGIDKLGIGHRKF